MRLKYLIPVLIGLSFSCQKSIDSEPDLPYFGDVESIEVKSFKLVDQGDTISPEEITDSVPAWIPIEENSWFFNQRQQKEVEYLGTLFSNDHPDTLLFKYDDSGRLFNKAFRTGLSKENRTTTYMYNEDGQLNAINVLTPDNELDSVFLFNYDSEGTLRSINEFHNAEDYQDFVASLVKKYFYTVKNMERIDHYAKNPYTGKHYYAKRIIKKFRPNGLLFEEKIESGGTTKLTYEYDNGGRLTAILTYDDLNQLIEKTSFEYDSYGNIVLKSFRSDVESYTYRCDYQYDDQQNWIEKRIRLADDENASYIVKRTFVYRS